MSDVSDPIDDATWQRLIDEAKAAAAMAYAPYSDFQVGAALLAADGSVIRGCNVENATFGATVCAERVAIGTALVEGKRDFVALCVVTPAEHPVAPCGICRQVLAEFADDLPILLINQKGDRLEVTLDELLPHRFIASDFKEG